MSSHDVNRSSTTRCTTNTALVIRVQRCFVVDRDFFTRLDITQGDKEDVIVKNLHERVWRTRMIDVMRSISTATSIQAPPAVDFANP